MGLQATNAGIDFQQRVAAYMMLMMQFDMDISLATQLKRNDKIVGLNFEACQCIDDLVATLDSGKIIYFQMKRTISLSESKTSDFYSVCEQFVKQHLKQNQNDVAYILATRSESSSKIIVKLKRILDGIRLANSMQIVTDLNQEERNVFDKVCNNIKKIYYAMKNEDITEESLLKIIKLIYVEIFDIENGEEYEKTIKLILSNLVSVDVELFWRTLISKAVEYGANRRYLSNDVLKDQCKAYIEKNQGDKQDFVEQFFKVSWKDEIDDIEVQLDYVIAIPLDNTKHSLNIESKTVFIMELYRFDDSKKKNSVQYIPPNKMIIKNGFEFEVLYRCSTRDRSYKYIENELNNKLSNPYEVVVWPVKEYFNYTDVELLHQKVLLKSLDKQNECKCVNCGKAIFDNKSYCVEIDNEEGSDVLGFVHHKCIRPVDRVIGEIIIPNVEDYAYLKSFDINTWLKLIVKGKQAWSNISMMATKCPAMTIDTDEVFHDGNYCLYHILENGDKRYLTNRGVIDRLSKEEAEELQKKFSVRMKSDKLEGDPTGYSSETYIYGRYSQIIEQVGEKEEFVECVDTKVTMYSETVAKIYNDCETYYSPIIYLSVDGKPFILPNGIFPMLTDPFELPKFLKNWEQMGVEISDYEICIIKDDNEFILKMISLITNHVLPVVDGLYKTDGEMIRGVHIHLMWELQQYNMKEK